MLEPVSCWVWLGYAHSSNLGSNSFQDHLLFVTCRWTVDVSIHLTVFLASVVGAQQASVWGEGEDAGAEGGAERKRRQRGAAGWETQGSGADLTRVTGFTWSAFSSVLPLTESSWFLKPFVLSDCSGTSLFSPQQHCLSVRHVCIYLYIPWAFVVVTLQNETCVWLPSWRTSCFTVRYRNH